MENITRLYSEHQMNVLMQALYECARDTYHVDEPYIIYRLLSETPKTSLVAELVEKLNEMGYHITKHA